RCARRVRSPGLSRCHVVVTPLHFRPARMLEVHESPTNRRGRADSPPAAQRSRHEARMKRSAFLKSWREQTLALSRSFVAERAGMTNEDLGDIEEGRREPWVDEL